MDFEFNENKSKVNREKHGIDFLEAQKLWEDPDRIEISVKYLDEPRYLVIGKIDENHWSAIFAYRNKKIRIISVRRSGKMKKRYTKADEFDKRFDKGEDISEFLDISKARRPGQGQRRVNVDFPIWMIQSLDKEAKRLGVTRQSIIKIWIAERLKHSSV